MRAARIRGTRRRRAIHPAMSVGRRPIRSDSAPPGVFDAVFTRCSSAQRIGASAIGTPSWLARSSRKASVELPSVKTKITASTRQNRRAEREREVGPWLGRCLCDRVGMSRTPNATTSTASAPGIAASQNTVRSAARTSSAEPRTRSAGPPRHPRCRPRAENRTRVRECSDRQSPRSARRAVHCESPCPRGRRRECASTCDADCRDRDERSHADASA